MFAVTLTFSQHRDRAKALMADHNAWLQKGFDDKVFLLAGGIKPGVGGYILAKDVSLEQLQARVNDDPFVAEQVVSADIQEIVVNKLDARLTQIVE